MPTLDASRRLLVVVRKRRLSLAEAAQELGLTKQYLSLLALGKRRPALFTALCIWAWSDGAVAVKGWLRAREQKRLKELRRRVRSRRR